MQSVLPKRLYIAMSSNTGSYYVIGFHFRPLKAARIKATEQRFRSSYRAIRSKFRLFTQSFWPFGGDESKNTSRPLHAHNGSAISFVSPASSLDVPRAARLPVRFTRVNQSPLAPGVGRTLLR